MEVTAPFGVRGGISLIFLSAAMEFHWGLMPCSYSMIAPLCRWHRTVQGEHTVAPSTCMHLINVPLMVLHLALRHLLQHSSQRHPLSFQMFTCPSKQTQTFGFFSPACHLTERDRKEDESRWEKRGESGVLTSATLHLSQMAHLAPVISEAIVWCVSVKLIPSFGRLSADSHVCQLHCNT